jgi:hypothetical protein
MPPPPPRRRPDDSATYSRRRQSYANSYRAVSPTPAPRARASKAATPEPFEADEDVPMMDATFGGDDMSPGADFVVPLNFDSSHSATAPTLSFFTKSPRKGTPVRARPGSPWLRSPSALGRENAGDDNAGGWGFAPLQDAPSDDSDDEVDQHQEIVAERVNVPPTEYYSAVYEDNQGPEEAVNDEYASPSANIETAPRGRSTTVSPLSRGNASQHRSKIVTPAQTASPVSASGFSGGKLLSQRFAELENKLAAEGRSFRFSEIGALPSSPAVGEGYDRTELKFPDLPSSSPDKSTTNEDGQEEEKLDESRVENDLSSEVAEEEQAESRQSFGREDSAENGLNEYSQENTEQANSMDEYDYSMELPQEGHSQEPVEPSYQDSAEVVVAAVTNASWQSVEIVQDAGAVEASVEEGQDWNISKALDSSVRSPTLSVRNEDEEDASFISPIRPKDSPPMPIDDMEDSESVSSDESDEDDMDERGIIAESTYEQDVQPQHLSSLIEDKPNVLQEPSSSRRSMPAEATETTENQAADYDETIEEEMVHGPSWEDETDVEPLVQLRSNDPMAAARAAAILNLVSILCTRDERGHLT